ncbi:MAG: hypothetical protein U5L07_17070 [Desulfobacterales bacterium]|nr:hypothetical protein [Desulfobacterales bacterium]
MSDPAAGSRLTILERERLHDAAFEFRSKHSARFKQIWQVDLHYEMIGTGGSWISPT